MSQWLDKLREVRKFVLHDVWSIELAGASGTRGILSRIVRVGHLIARGYREDDLTVHAASLTFSFLMSLVPMLAIASALLKGLGAQKGAVERLMDFNEALPKEGQEFIQQVVAIVERTNFVALGWIGVVVLFVTAVRVLANIEDSFNKIWGVQARRTWWQRFTNYTSITIVVPILVAAAFALSASARAGVLQKFSLFGLTGLLLKLVPLVTTWLAFFTLYTFMPNTRVSKRAAITASLTAALMWIGWQKMYLLFQFGIARYNAIYGTFASIPVFLFWMFVGWTIILFGAELCFALQNQATYHLERVAQSASVEARLTLALGLLADATENFQSGSTVFDAEEYGHARRVPIRMVNDITRLLCRGGLLVEVAEQPGIYAFKRTPDKIRLQEVFDLLLHDGTAPAPLGLTRNIHAAAAQTLAHWQREGGGSLADRSLADMLGETAKT